MHVDVNGQRKQIPEKSVTVKDLLESCGMTEGAFAVAINAEVIPRSEFRKISLRDGDRVEIIRPVGGG